MKIYLVILISGFLSFSGFSEEKWTPKVGYAEVIERAKSGSHYFQGLLGIYLRSGEAGSVVNLNLSSQWSELASKNNHPFGTYNLANLSMLKGDFEKAIISSDLGLNPSVSSDLIRVPLPALTEERRKEIIKKVKGEGESTKVAVRNIRRDVNGVLKDLEKKGEIGEDEQRRGEDRIQKMTDKYVKDIDVVLEQKEKDLLDF